MGDDGILFITSGAVSAGLRCHSGGGGSRSTTVVRVDIVISSVSCRWPTELLLDIVPTATATAAASPS